ncbi:MAG TPA: MerR family transcriptional regulator [Lactobacillus sp.]|nr:MerR family transcriptional regulator [Lactobacillus sp.]
MARASLRDTSNGKIFSMVNLIFGIGQISKMTDVSTRQLRYWESKGYIHPKKREDGNTSRVYGYDTFLKVSGIKLMLDEGYTLAASVERTDALMNEAFNIRSFLLDAYHGEATVEGHTMLDLGYFDDAHTQRLYARTTENGHVHYVVKPENEAK